MKKKLLILVFLISIVFFNIDIVLADCSDCLPGDCESCGCVSNSDNTACIYSNYDDNNISCGEGLIDNIPSLIPKVISIIYIVVQVAVPVVLVVMGSLDLMKSISAQKEDEIKKGQSIFIKRLIAAALIFFVFAIVKIVISFVADNSKILDCAECFIENKCD